MNICTLTAFGRSCSFETMRALLQTQPHNVPQYSARPAEKTRRFRADGSTFALKNELARNSALFTRRRTQAVQSTYEDTDKPLGKRPAAKVKNSRDLGDFCSVGADRRCKIRQRRPAAVDSQEYCPESPNLGSSRRDDRRVVPAEAEAIAHHRPQLPLPRLVRR